jgi:carbonic anhydrase/acetyltransferase-like protein (isoleucine patch superfamily)
MADAALPEHFLKGTPSIHPEAFLGAGTKIQGDVRLARGASVWYNCVLRGDLNYISIGENSNLQDGCIAHVESSVPCLVGDHVTVGHGAILHACTVESGCLIGMGAIILSGAVIGRGSIVAAGALVGENARIEPFSLVVGVPARLVRKLPEDTYAQHMAGALKYAEAARRHREYALDSGGTGI